MFRALLLFAVVALAPAQEVACTQEHTEVEAVDETLLEPNLGIDIDTTVSLPDPVVDEHALDAVVLCDDQDTGVECTVQRAADRIAALREHLDRQPGAQAASADPANVPRER